jgi:hypothetical protein
MSFFAIEAGYGTGLGLGAIFFGVDFIVAVGIEAAETVIALVV